MQQRHTPGPWRYDECNYIWADADGPKPIVEMEKGSDGIGRARSGSSDADARLIVASVNAVQAAARRLGIPAVELAEGLQHGQIADLLESIDDVSNRMKRLKRILHHPEKKDPE